MEEIAEGIFVSTEYFGVNVGAIISKRGIICIDVPSYPDDARHWATQVNRLSARSVRYVILTDAQGDRILNSRWLNGPLIMQQSAAETLFSYEKRYPANLIESLNARSSLASRDFASSPVDHPSLSFSQELTLFAGERSIVLKSKVGPSFGSSWVYIPDAKVLFAGDGVTIQQHPFWSEPVTATWLRNLKSLADSQSTIDTIIPGRGSIIEPDSVEILYAYLKKVRADIRQLIKSGINRDQVGRRAALLMNEFPIGDLSYDWVYRQVSRSLVALFDELTNESYAPEKGDGSTASSAMVQSV